jgi:hypothetical protein
MIAPLPQLQGGEPKQTQEHGDDPKTNDDLGFFPALFFKMVV